MTFELRDYQQRAVDSVLSAFSEGHRVVLIVLATGLGKTVIAAHIAKEMLKSGRVMAMAHRDELIRQAVRKFRSVTNVEPAIEKANEFSQEDGFDKPPIVVTSVQTQNSGSDDVKRMTRFDPTEFSLLWIDEAHRSVAASYMRCLEHYQKNPDLKVLLVTATPDRADDRGLAEICQHVAFTYPLNESIKDGWLVPVRQRRVYIDGLDFSKVATVGGDLDQLELEEVMIAERPLHGTVQATLEAACCLEIGFLETIKNDFDRVEKLRSRLTKIRRTLIFTVSVAHAERFAEIVNRWIPESAAFVSGATPKDDRDQIFAAFASGRIHFLANCMVATEGYDNPSIELISVSRPTKSRPLYTQMIGRGGRPLESIAHKLGNLEAEDRRKLILLSEKPFVEILDFTGNCGRHKLICTADILGIAHPQEVVDRAAEISDAEEMDMTEALDQAKRQIEQEQDANLALAEMEAEEADVQELMRASAAARRRLNVVATADYRIKTVSAFDNSSEAPVVENPDGPTPKQIGMLAGLGVSAKVSAGYGRQQASVVIDKLMKERCTDRQAWALRKSGYSEGEIKEMNFESASKAIDQIRRKSA